MIRRFAAWLLGIGPERVVDRLHELERGLKDALETAHAARSEVKQQRIDFELLYDKAAAAVSRLNTRARRAAASPEAGEPSSGAAQPEPNDLAQAIREGRVSILNARRRA